MKRFLAKHLVEPFLLALAEVAWFGPVVSAVLVALLVNIATEFLTALGGLWLAGGAIGLLVIATVLFVNAYTATERRRRSKGLGPLQDLENPAPRRGLIFVFSREDTLREAIKHHRPALERCWLLTTPEMQEIAGQVVGHFSGVSFSLQPLAGRYDSQGCYQAVRDIYRGEASRLGLAPDEVIADITGGTKPLTMGMIVACLEGNFPLEHVPTAFDAAGNPTGPLPPIQIRVQRGGSVTMASGEGS